ncbi:MAG: MotA/TolQ/ExbB proton channel family protein [Myxococcota bacterium]|jgi:biopolymer transport protein ExbB/TolQ|nr:MotA/TolQ/ExbB proton channel family protein [Myxococcota bacterium]
MMQGIAEAFVTGGGWMYVIIIPSVVGLGVMVERFVFLFFKYNINAKAFMAQINKLVMANNIDRAIKLCNAAPNAALPKVIKAGLTRANKGELEISNAIEEATLEVVPVVTNRTPLLGGVANVATLLGLLGTITGLIQAFAALESAAPEQRAAALARGIAVAMNTTAFGLIVAIPCMAAQMFLQSVTKKILDEIDQYSVKLENLLVSRIRAGGMPMQQ